MKKKYLNITLELVSLPKLAEFEKKLVAGDEIDLMGMWNGDMLTVKNLGLYEDITPLAGKQKFDLSRFDKGAIDTLKGLSKTECG